MLQFSLLRNYEYKQTTFIQVLKSINIFIAIKFVKPHYKNNPNLSKCICTNIEKINDFQYYMHIIWNEPFESDNLGKGQMTF
jgi:hypothetical protein